MPAEAAAGNAIDAFAINHFMLRGPGGPDDKFAVS
jgi:hypothetical protein